MVALPRGRTNRNKQMAAADILVVSMFLLVLEGIQFSKGAGMDDSFNITILTEGQREHDIKTFVRNFTKVNALFQSMLNIHVGVIRGDSFDFMSLLRQFSNFEFLEESSFIVTDLEIPPSLIESLLATTSSVVLDIRNRPYLKDREFTNVIFLKPSMEEQGKAMKHFIQRMGFKNIETFDHCSSITTKMNTANPGDSEISRHLNEIKSKKPAVIIVNCPDNIETVLRIAKALDMYNDVFKWILPEMIEYRKVTSYFLENLLVFSMHSHYVSRPHSRDVTIEQGYLSYLEDSFAVIKTLAEEIRKFDERSEGVRGVIKRLISTESFRSRVGNIAFNSKGCRTNVTYDIFEMVTFLGERRWLHVGTWLDGKVHTIFMQWTGNNSVTSHHSFRVVTYNDEPWVSFTPEQNNFNGGCLVGHLCRNYTNQDATGMEETADHESCCNGFMIDLLLELERRLEFKADVHFVKDGKFGSPNRTVTTHWSGMIGELERGEADIALQLLTITAERLKVVSFSQSFMEAAHGILVSSQPFSHSTWDFVFLNTFSVALWLSMFAICCTVVMVMWSAERLRLRRCSLLKPHKPQRAFNFLEVISYTWSLAFQKAAEEMGPTSLAGRVLAGLFAFFTIIACSSFTANLAAIKVTENRGISLSGIYDSKFHNPSEEFKFSILSDSASLDYFRGNSDPHLRRMAKSLKLVDSYPEASQKLKDRQIQAFLSDIVSLKTLVYKENCDLRLAGKPFFFSGYGLAFSKNFIWQRQFSMAILKLQDEGFFDELIEKWIPHQCPSSQKVHGPERLGLKEIGGTFLLLTLGGLFGVMSLIFEKWMWRISQIYNISNDSQKIL